MQLKSEKKSPLIKTVNDFMMLLKATMLLVFIGFCFSGITLIKPDEVGFVMRMGRLTGSNRVDQIHPPGWVLAFPKPVDQVIKVPVKQIREVRIRELSAVKKKTDLDYRNIDPTTEGYCISGDENIFQASILVKYQITDPVAAVFNNTDPYRTFSSLINDLTVSEMGKISGRFSIDGILSENKKQLSVQVREKVQALLDQLKSGLTIVALEFEELSPPVFLKRDFEEVNSAFINRRNFINDAKSLSEEKLPKARGTANEMVNLAYAYRESVIAEATAEAGKFSQLLQAYLQNPQEVKMAMIDKARKTLLSAMSNMVVFPAESDCEAGIRTFLGNEGKTGALPYSIDEYSEDEN